MCASKPGPARPRAIGCDGAGGWVIASQDRHENFSRTCWITFHCRGITSNVSVTSSPSLCRTPPQHGQAHHGQGAPKYTKRTTNQIISGAKKRRAYRDKEENNA